MIKILPERICRIEFLLMMAIIAPFLLLGCVRRAEVITPETARQTLKLRGYDFSVKGLTNAVYAEDIWAITVFASAEINPNEVNDKGETAIALAAQQEKSKSLDALLKFKNIDLNFTDARGETALLAAMRLNRDLNVQKLLDKGADVNKASARKRTPIFIAIDKDRADWVETLIEKGANVNAEDDEGFTPLIEAAVVENNPIAETLLQKGANVNAQAQNGGTPLIYASSTGNAPLVEIFLKAGADKNAKDKDGKNALAWAKYARQTNAAAVLEKAK